MDKSDEGRSGSEITSPVPINLPDTASSPMGKRWTPRVVAKVTAVYLVTLVSGASVGTLGAALLDLGLQTGADIDKLGLLYTWMFFGALLGTMTTSLVFDRFHPEMQLGLACVFMVVGTLLIPITADYIVVSFAFAAQGYCVGYQLSGGMSAIYQAWEGKGSTRILTQVFFLFMAFGLFLGPVIVKPFLTPIYLNITDNNSISLSWNGTSQEETRRYDNISDRNTRQTGTFYPYLILGLSACIPLVMFWLQFMMDKCKAVRHVPGIHHQPDTKMNCQTEINYPMLIMILVAIFCSFGVEGIQAGLLYAYLVKAHKWNPQPANDLLLFYRGIMVISRGLGVPIVRVVGPKILLPIVISFIAGMSLITLMASNLSAVVLWVTGAGMGISMANLLGLWYILGSEYLPRTGRIVGIYQSSQMLGAMVMPAVSGYIFKLWGTHYFPHIVLALAVALMADYIFIRVCDMIQNRNRMREEFTTKL